MDRGIRYGGPMKTASFSDADLKRLDEIAADRLREKGYLVLAPGDASPVGGLVRAAVEYIDDTCEVSERTHVALLEATSEAAHDPNVRQWAERGRE